MLVFDAIRPSSTSLLPFYAHYTCLLALHRSLAPCLPPLSTLGRSEYLQAPNRWNCSEITIPLGACIENIEML